jgi:hypothetical protein
LHSGLHNILLTIAKLMVAKGRLKLLLKRIKLRFFGGTAVYGYIDFPSNMLLL